MLNFNKFIVTFSKSLVSNGCNKQLSNQLSGKVIGETYMKLHKKAGDIEVLAKKAVRGNVNAYGELVEYHKEYLYRTAMAFVKDEESALDIVQDCIIKGFQGIRKLKNPEYFKTWITRILINTAKNQLRTRVTQIAIDSLEVPQKESGVSMEEKWDLYEAIDALPEKYKIIIILKYFNDMQIEEIAYALEMPEGSVKSYLFRARQELKAYLKEGYIYAQ